VLISLDTVRRDHLPTYGYERYTAPFLDSLARRSIVFDQAFSQDTNTNPSHTSMLTGLYPHVHGSYANGVPLAPDQITLAGILAGVGFRTGGFVSGATMQDEAAGLARGFEVYDDEFTGYRRDGRETAERARQWLRRLRRGERYFLFLHLYDAHGPYQPKGEYADLFHSEQRGTKLRRIPDYQKLRKAGGRLERHVNSYVDRYDAMIRYLDDCVAAVLETVDLDRTIVVIVADHGETFDERYGVLGHGAAVYDEQTRIPLMIHVPAVAAGRNGDLTETVDLVPTLLELLEIERPPFRPVQGRSLVSAMLGRDSAVRDHVFSSARAAESHYVDRLYRLDARRRIHSVRSARWKLILYPGIDDDYVELYDLTADPLERASVADQHPELRDGYLELLREWLEGGAKNPPPELNSELREKLESLGYVEGA
jgi:arylsulfatase A-like enzyme